jgi:hypothetical protein
MPDTVDLSDHTLEALHDSFHSGVETIVRQTHELGREISREVEIRLSPLEKFLKKRVVVQFGLGRTSGVLVDFGGGFVELDIDGKRHVCYTAQIVSIYLDDEEEKT